MGGRRPLLRFAGWFGAANAAVLAVVGLRFLLGYPFATAALGLVYTALAYIGQFALLGALPVGLVVVPLALVVPRRSVVMGAAVLLGALVLTLLVVDANVFAEQRYHLTPLTAMLFETSTWAFVGLIGIFALAFEALLAGWVWRWVTARPARGGPWLALALAGCWVVGQLIHIWADAIGYVPVTQLTRYLPAYFPIHAKAVLARLGVVDRSTAEQQALLRKVGAGGAGELDYPLKPLQCGPAGTSARPANILWVIIDALRPDAVDSRLMPNLAGLRAEGADFANHWSGGNSSRAGIFAMFYGLPSTYLDAFYGVKEPPVLMDELRRRGYQFALFAAPGFGSPTDIGRTVFAGEAGLPMAVDHELTSTARNRQVTDRWLEWLGRRDVSRPFFGFLYYDPPMGEMPASGGGPLAQDERFASDPKVRGAWRQYRLSAALIDGELGRALTGLRADGLLDDTLVIVLSDHGYEFDDNGLGYVGHASDYSPAQLRATLVMRWPGRPPAVYRHRSSHYDIPVTLLEDLFACSNDPADYAVGSNLFAGRDWPWIIAGSYNSHAIIEPGRAIVTYPGGAVEVLGPDYRPLPEANFDRSVVAAALREMRRYYR